MPFFVALKAPLRDPGVEIVGPFADRETAEAQPRVQGGQTIPARIIEAADAEVARSIALAAFGPGNPDA